MNTKEKQWKCVCNKEAKEFSLCDDCEVKNKLTAFLEENKYIKLPCECGGKMSMEEHNTRLINTLLDIVGEEIEKEEYCSKCCSPKEYCPEWGEWESALPTKEIKKILTKIKSSL